MSAGDQWKQRVLAQYAIAEADAAFQTVELGARALDRAADAQARLDEEGYTIDGLHGIRVHPLVSVVRDAEASHLRACRLLGIYDVAEGD
jgi:phage terminase small subunit